MSKMGSFFNQLTGSAARHNRALREVTEWLAAVEKFLVAYKLLKGKSATAGLLENSGDVKFDLTGLVHKGRSLADTARDIKAKQVVPLMAGTIETMEGMRRSLMSPSLQKEKLAGTITDLRQSFEALRGALEKIDYL